MLPPNPLVSFVIRVPRNFRGPFPLSLALVTLVVFSPTLWNSFVEWDDQVNLVNNPYYRGLGWRELQWMFTTIVMGHYIPLTWLTFGVDYLLWGMNPVGYHLTNLLLHAANAVVFYFVALYLLSRATAGLGETTLRLGAGVAALFFAIHPLRAESVAWATERRDVLSGLFFLLTILTYLKACDAEGGRRRRLLAGSVGCYVLALASKSIVMTLPFILILLDIYPLRRLGGRWREWIAPSVRRVWAEKIPYLLLALAGAGTALYAVSPNLTALERYPLASRLAIALSSLWFYLWKTVFPLGLSPMYELPARVNLLDPPFLGSAIAVGIITGGFLLMRRKWPAGLAVWVAYGVMLAPVSGFPFHVGAQIAQDRYSYLSCLGWALLVGAGGCAVVRARASGRLRPWAGRLAAGAAAFWLIGLGALTWQQVQVWRDTEVLWRYALEFDPNCSFCHNNLGVFLDTQGLSGVAVKHLQRALALRPDRKRIHGGLGLALLHSGRPAESIEHFQRFLEQNPADVDILTNLGFALIQEGKPELAIEHLQRALAVRRDRGITHGYLGLALLKAGRLAEAIEHLQRAVERNPADAEVLNNLGIALIQEGKPGEGIERLKQAILLNPAHVEARTNLGMALTGLGKPAEAIEHFRRAIELKPEIPLPHFGLAQAYQAQGKTRSAQEEYDIVKRLDPSLASQLSPRLQRDESPGPRSR